LKLKGGDVKRITGYHHFKGSGLDAVGELERRMVRFIADSSLPDENRESSKCWEVKHSSGTVQLARLLAQKRGLDESVAAMALALHDIHVIESGSYKDHARLGAPRARQILGQLPNVDHIDVEQIVRMIEHHSAKEEFSDDPYVELAKDVDVLDCFLYPDAEQFYLTVKPLGVCKYYFRRIASIRRELSLPRYPRYECLESFGPGWLSYTGKINDTDLSAQLCGLFPPGQYQPAAEAAPITAFYIQSGQGIQVFSERAPLTPAKFEKRPEVELVRDELLSEKTSLLVCWPAFNSYELLHGNHADERLSKLDVGGAPMQQIASGG
jgi:HD domain